MCVCVCVCVYVCLGVCVSVVSALHRRRGGKTCAFITSWPQRHILICGSSLKAKPYVFWIGLLQ